MIALCRLHGIPARYAGGTWIEPEEEPGGSPLRRQDDITPHVDRVFHRWVEVLVHTDDAGLAKLFEEGVD